MFGSTVCVLLAAACTTAGYGGGAGVPQQLARLQPDVGLPRGCGAKCRAIWPHVVHQKTNASCSVASITTVLNTALAHRHRPKLSQAEVLASDTTGLWAAATGPDPNCPGVDLDALALYAMRSFFAVGQKNVGVEVRHVEENVAPTRDALRHALCGSEAEVDSTFIVVNFHQKTLIAAGDDVGHMSVVAGYNAKADAVLIADVDNRGLAPYWVGLSRLVEAMSSHPNTTPVPRGYLIIRLNR